MKLIKQIATEIKKYGGRALLVGGYVRDQFLGVESKDYDLEVFNIQPDKLIRILKKFGKVNDVGKSFGVLKLDNNIDISMPRRERKTGKGYKGFSVSVNPFMSYEDACRRRDLTINAMMLDPLTYELIDPFNGFQDIKTKTLRFVDGKTFAEDPLRVLRVAQFKGRFGFNVAPKTSWLCVSLKSELKYLSKERIFVEIEKLLMRADKPSLGFEWLGTFDILEELLPELDVLYYVKQGKKYHPEGNVFRHTMLSIDSVPMEDRTMTNMLAVLLHDTGKAICKSEVAKDDPDHIHFKHHAQDGIEPTRSFLNRITNETKLIENVVSLVANHMSPYTLKKHMKKRTLRRLALKVDVPNVLIVHKADKNGRGIEVDLSYVNDIEVLYDEIKNEIHQIMKGRHLIKQFGMPPGKYFGKILEDAFEAQLDGVFNTEEGGITFLSRYLEFDIVKT